MFEIQSVVWNQLFAVSRLVASASALRCAPLAAAKAIVAVVATTPTATSCGYLRTCPAAGTLASAANRTRSAQIMTGLFRRCSIRAPSGSMIAAAVSPDKPDSSDT